MLLKANGVDLNAKMGFHEFEYEPIVDACRCGDSEMVSLLLELGVELADVGRPGRRLDWYKQYLRDDAVDSQLTALLPAELNARTNLEVRQEKERLEAAKRAEEQRLLEAELEKKRKGAVDCVRCQLLFFPDLPAEHVDQPGPCRHHNAKTLCCEEGRGYDTGSDWCCQRSCCWRGRRSAGCCVTPAHSSTDTLCGTCGAWQQGAATPDECVQHSGRFISEHRIRGSRNARKKILEKLALVADPSIPETKYGVRRKPDTGDYVKLLKATADVPPGSIGKVACPWQIDWKVVHVDFPERRGVTCQVTDVEYVKPPRFDLEKVIREKPYWSCCGNESFSSRGCVAKAHEWKQGFNPDPDRSAIPSILRAFGQPC